MVDNIKTKIAQIDEYFEKNISLSHVDYKKYGLVQQYLDYNGDTVNLADNDLQATDGIWAGWDDRFSLVWFHRVEAAQIDSMQPGFGSKSGSNLIVRAALVVWSKKIIRFMTETEKLSQFELNESMIGMLVGSGIARVNSVEFNMPSIARREFGKEGDRYINKESNLIRIEYEFNTGSVINCNKLCKFAKC